MNDKSETRATSWSVVALCALVIIAEGYDMIVYGALLPVLLTEPGWGLDSTTAGAIGSVIYVGMLVGGLTGGPLADRFGRRPFVLASVACFTLATLGCAVAAAPWQLAVFRLVAGVGMGAVLPAVLALAREFTPEGRTALTVTSIMAGVPIGGTLAALLGIVVLPAYGWRAMFWVGVVISALVLVVVVFRLPESGAYVAEAERSAGRARADRSRVAELLGRRYRVETVLFVLASFTCLLTATGFTVWLVTVMRELGYPLTSALQLQVTNGVGALIGPFVVAAAGDRWGIRPVGVVAAALTALSLLALTVGTFSGPVLLGLLALMGVAGTGTLNMVSASVAATYPVRLRGTALGWTNGLGRLGAILAPVLGGWLLASALGPISVFVALLISATCSTVLLAVLAVLSRRAQARRDPIDENVPAVAEA